MPTPTRQLPKRVANELFYYRDGYLYWKKSGSGRCVFKPAGVDLNTGYRRIVINGDSYQYHNILWNVVHGKIPKGMTVDHIDRDPSNNSIKNLRLLNYSLQNCNKSMQSNNTSGVVGVNLADAGRFGKWEASINVNGKKVRLGRFSTVEEAAKVRKDAEAKYHHKALEVSCARR